MTKYIHSYINKNMKYITNSLLPKYRQSLLDASKHLNLSDWDVAPNNRWSFNHVDKILPTRIVANNPKSITNLPTKLNSDIANIKFKNHLGKEISVQKFCNSQYVDALVVAHKGTIVHEEYFGFNDATTPHLTQSVGKSLVGACAQILKSTGDLNPQWRVSDIVPELKNSAYHHCTIQHLLDMRSGVNYAMSYEKLPLSGDSLGLDVANGWKPKNSMQNPPKNNMEYAQNIKELVQQPGSQMIYRCPDTDVVGHCLEKITKKNLADILSELIWQKIGAEQSSYYSIDPSGFPCASGGHSGIARDYLRFALMMNNDGFYNNQQIIAKDFVRECFNPAPYGFDTKDPELMPCGAYKNFFWIVHQKPRVILGVGVFGQVVYMHPENEVAIVKFATYPYAINNIMWHNEVYLMDNIAKYFSK